MDREAIAKKLVDLRDGRSRDFISKTLGISVSALSMYENAARIPRDEIKQRIAKFYNSTVDEIFFD